VLDQGMTSHRQIAERRGGQHAAEGTNFAIMKEYQAVVLKLSRRAHDDEDVLTDLLNERSRGGWEPALLSQEGARMTVVFQRALPAARKEK
jgi:hypothetical protein